MEEKTNLAGLTKSFAIDAILFNDKLQKDRRFTLSNQFSRSATSIGANVFEARFAESKKDFLHKMKIAEKEANETGFWLDILASTTDYEEVSVLQGDVIVIQKILSRSIQTIKRKLSEEQTNPQY
jgi:four helix bundle protein